MSQCEQVAPVHQTIIFTTHHATQHKQIEIHITPMIAVTAEANPANKVIVARPAFPTFRSH